MSRKDFEAIAGILAATKPYLRDSDDEWVRWRTIARMFAADLGMTHRRFDRDKFLSACGLTYAEIHN